MNINKVLIAGNLTRDPELRYTSGGAAMVSFKVATNHRWTDSQGVKKEEVAFIKVVVWGKMAKNCGKYLSKGSPVFVEGRLKQQSWETDAGEKRSSLEVVAQNVQFLGRPANEADGVRLESDNSSADKDEGENIPF